MYLYPGLLMVGHLQEKRKGIVNGGFYKIVAVGDDVKLTDEASQKELVLSHDFVTQHLRLCYAITIASCQGSTLRGRIRIYSAHPRFTKRHLSVTISRATSSALVQLV